jgi:hypothetical protein
MEVAADVRVGAKWSVEICHARAQRLRTAWLPPAARRPSFRSACDQFVDVAIAARAADSE